MDEQAAMQNIWRTHPQRSDFASTRPALERWYQARAVVAGPGSRPAIDAFRATLDYAYYLNCPDDSFVTAARTLDEHASRWGATSPDVKAWLAGQDQVFANCAGGRHIPPSVNGATPAWLRADRAYQIAAAHFYAGDFDDAIRRFGEIAADSTSSWRDLAPYLVARSLVRKATLVRTPVPDVAGLASAEARLRAILADPNQATMHAAAGRLRNFIRARLEPEQRAGELARAILKPHAGPSLASDVEEYTHVLDRVRGIQAPGPRDDLTTWMLGARMDRVEQWRTRSSLPWLIDALDEIASLAEAGRPHPRAGEVLDASRRVPDGSPGFPMVTFHVARLAIASGRVDEARDRITKLLDDTPSLPASTRNRFLALRFGLARSLDELVRDAARVPADVVEGDESTSVSGTAPLPGPLFTPDAVSTLNAGLPLRRLSDVAASASLPDRLRRDVALAAWTRAVVLEDHTAALALRPVLERLVAEAATDLTAYRTASSPSARRFAAALLLLRTPGAKPDVAGGLVRSEPPRNIDRFRDNWWCAGGSPKFVVEDPGAMRMPPVTVPAFLTGAERQALSREQARLRAIATGPNYLAAIVIDWANRHPGDTRVPEALHRAVKSTRFGCTDVGTSQFSRQAFQILHRRYPQSPWTAQTPYWF